jgi:SpoVK/Ycf46/Vps4 family AAA+-type ATPase
MRCRERVLDDWHLRRGASGGLGTHALFSGPSGTGKTAAAQVVAGALGFQLWKVDLACVVSKYIGETEKNLDAIFEAAAGCDVVLLFDEADALFGKRSEVRDAHGRYANVEISYLLQRMEEHEGVTILATNLRHNLDAAFLRRLAFDVRFPFPDATQRLAIWHRSFPAETPLGPGIDLAALAERFTLSGGQIRNVAVAAAYLAAAEDAPVSPCHLQRAVRREFQKLGKDIGMPSRTDGSAP